MMRRKIRESDSGRSIHTTKFIPFGIAFPLLVIAFWGCVEDGCQGALNAQSKAVHTAVEAGGWNG